MSPSEVPAHGTRTFATFRRDAWWIEPFLMVLYLGGFVAYAMWRVFEMGVDPVVEKAGWYHYQSPFVSVDLTFLFQGVTDTVPYLAYPALLVLPFPAGFRFTCYYFRRAYYRSFVARPAGCATEAWNGVDYKGETRLLAFQNFHRYFLYATMVLLVFHVLDAVRAHFPEGFGGRFYLGLGNILLWTDIILLGGYVLGCHALRHLVGGRLDCFSCTSLSQGQHSVWEGVSKLNAKHHFYALASIASIVVADFYIRWLGHNPDIDLVLGVFRP